MSTPFFMRKLQGDRDRQLENRLKTKRGMEWHEFSELVADHIDTYTIPQYGDAPDDQASAFSAHDMAVNIRRYVNRLESSQRGPDERQRDLLKIAHYCAMLYFRRREHPEFAEAWKRECIGNL
jgi:hypothetical protein